MSTFKVGFSRVDITPPLGIPIAGYFVKRLADGVLDNLDCNCIAVSDGEKTALLYSLDLISINQKTDDVYRAVISKATGVPYEGIFLACTHTHTGPSVGRGDANSEAFDEGIKVYDEFLGTRLADAGVFAIADLSEASMYIGRSRAERVAFIRRYRMKDGSIRTNPGVNNPEIDGPIGTPDDTVQVVRFKRPGKKEVVVVNFQVHPDVIGGNKISADWPRAVRETVEGALPGKVDCVFFNGTQGDTNHVCTDPREGELEGLELESFDDVARGYEHSHHMGRAIAGAALQVYGKCAPVTAGPVRYAHSVLSVPSQMPTPEQLPLAHKYNDLHKAGRDADIPFVGMQLTTVVAEAGRMVKLENGPDHFDLYLSSVAIGDVAFAGFPGEPFTDIGRGTKEGSPFKMTIACCLTNGSEGYFPVESAYKEGGYEARSSNFAAGISTALINGQVAQLKALK
ncbi:MAG: hypothetical protein VB111_09610 [Clostridiaceae bacterium]|nr:hypothetical protein [Clostridiaceae bacterium]